MTPSHSVDSCIRTRHPWLLLAGLVGLLAMFPSSYTIATVLEVPEDYPTIQGAINAAVNGDVVVVSPGTYVESINFLGKGITVRSLHGPQTTIITNEPTIDLVSIDHGEQNDAVLEGFTLFGGCVALHIVNSAPIIKRNVFAGQKVTSWAAVTISGLFIRSLNSRGNPVFSPTYGNAPAILVNNTITGCANGGISIFSHESPTIRNNIIAFNAHYGIHIQTEGDLDPDLVGYNCVYGQGVHFPDLAIGDYINIPFAGVGAISVDPIFASRGTIGHDSPCIDAGDPDMVYNDPDGSRNDIGAVPYSLSPGDCCVGRVGDADSYGDDEPTIGDIAAIIDAKFLTGSCAQICVSEADINQSGGAVPDCGDVSIADIAILIDYLFLTGTSLGLPDCL